MTGAIIKLNSDKLWDLVFQAVIAWRDWFGQNGGETIMELEGFFLRLAPNDDFNKGALTVTVTLFNYGEIVAVTDIICPAELGAYFSSIAIH